MDQKLIDKFQARIDKAETPSELEQVMRERDAVLLAEAEREQAQALLDRYASEDAGEEEEEGEAE